MSVSNERILASQMRSHARLAIGHLEAMTDCIEPIEALGGMEAYNRAIKKEEVFLKKVGSFIEYLQGKIA